MTYTKTISTHMAKITALFVAMIFSFVAFAHGQNCTLLPGFSPSTLTNGDARTAYSIPEATYTQSCEDARWAITCTNGTVINGNIYKYGTCIEHTRNNCTTPTGALHLGYAYLYSANTATYTQSCDELKQNLQCLNGVFTGWTNPSIYTFASCTDPNWRQCIDIWTNSYKDHGETVIWYLATSPWLGSTCATLQRTLTCYDSTRSGGNQTTMFSSCTNPPSFASCLDTWTNTSTPHGGWLTAYSNSTPSIGTCTDVRKPLTCINWLWSGNGAAQQVGLYSWCREPGTAPCTNIITNSGTVVHGSTVTIYTDPSADPIYQESCSDFDLSVRCTDGQRVGSWFTPGMTYYTWCKTLMYSTITTGSCSHPRLSGTYTPHLWFIDAYTGNAPTASYGCDSVKVRLYCNAWSRRLGSGWWSPVSTPTTSYFGSCGGCILPRWSALAEWATISAYSRTWVNFPQLCTNYSTTLSCSWWVLNGNWQTYQYSFCFNSGGLVSGIDLAIDQSPGIPWVHNLSGTLIAQWSSPQVNIVLENKWDVSFSWSIDTPGFLECTREEEDLVVYKSNTISSLVVNSVTKLGINIRIQSLFTQSLWNKTLVCRINNSRVGIDDVDVSNDVWSWVFEVVEADRFDLALMKSIDPISKNLDAAEWAKWTQGLQNFVFNNIMNVLFPLVIVLGILSAILWFYGLMFSNDENKIKESTRYIIYGVIGIVFIMSAKFIGQNVFNLLQWDVVWTNIAQWLYNNILFPFIKFAIYLVLGAMFVILVSRVITFLFGSDTDAQKKAGTLIGWNVISMLVIIWAKQIVEVIYGKQDQVLVDATNLGEIWSGVLADKNIPILYQVINYALGIASLVILVIIILQTIKLLMKPDDPAQIKSIKNSLLYMLIWILVLGSGYLIVNFAIIN